MNSSIIKKQHLFLEFFKTDDACFRSNDRKNEIFRFGRCTTNNYKKCCFGSSFILTIVHLRLTRALKLIHE